MNQYAVTAQGTEIPQLKVLAHSVTGALAKAERINASLFGPAAGDIALTARIVKRNVR